ncbi:MAG: hypothetical protein ACE5ID_10215 [Acidobacteriota bacterium]
MKYRQRGYRDDESKARRQHRSREEDEAREAARKVRHGMERDARVVLRCADCGHQTAGRIEVEPGTHCEKCGAALHNCRNCRSFDTQAHNQCRQAIPERMASKTAANECDFYEARAVLDATGKRARPAASNPRDAFDDLFKK